MNSSKHIEVVTWGRQEHPLVVDASLLREDSYPYGLPKSGGTL